MTNIENAQSTLVNDTCNDCGSYADIGAVIDEHDKQLIVTFSGAQAEIEAAILSQKVQVRFDDVATKLINAASEVRLKIDFSCSVEKMIFQLENSL